MQCRTVFDLATAGYSAWPAVAIGALVTAVTAAILLLVSRFQPVPPLRWLVPALAAAFTVAIFAGTWLQYRVALAALRDGRYEVVEGPIESFVPRPPGGHSTERFTVAGRTFEYADFAITPGFHRSRARGGPFAAGVYVRLRVRGNDILHAEVCEPAD